MHKIAAQSSVYCVRHLIYMNKEKDEEVRDSAIETYNDVVQTVYH